MINLFNYSRKKLEELLTEKYNQKRFRATQLFNWIYTKKIYDFDLMSDISKTFIDVLKKDFTLELPTIYTKQVSVDGTIKFLNKLYDNDYVETVIMPYNYGNVLCVSSQVGCNMGCAFCASGLIKQKRNLEVYEMIGQIMSANKLLEEKGQKITHVVLMGTGEPFMNYDNVMEFIRILNDPKGFEIGARHITVSTCGIVNRIIDYANEGLQINLAISLHAPNNEKRSKIMKINSAYPIEKLMEASKKYVEIADRRLTFEYILLKDFNDSYEDALELSKIIKGIYCYINIIPYNEVKENEFKRSEKVHDFLNYLTKLGVHAQIRKEFGFDIDAACGQLRSKQN